MKTICRWPKAEWPVFPLCRDRRLCGLPAFSCFPAGRADIHPEMYMNKQLGEVLLRLA
jgi:hypothetical protein